MKLSELIRQDHFASTGQEAMFSVLVTASWLQGELAGVMAPYGITPAQYNVLRILRGSHPKRLRCSDLGARLLDRTPDVTRLLNRLEAHDLIERHRADYDRRVVEVSITGAGLALLQRMTGVVERRVEEMTAHLDAAEHRLLCDLLERLRTDQQP